MNATELQAIRTRSQALHDVRFHARRLQCALLACRDMSEGPQAHDYGELSSAIADVERAIDELDSR
jgi:hypothetical protein